MNPRRRFLLGAAALLPLPAAAQERWGRVHEISGEVLLNGRPMSARSAVQSGQTVTTGADGRLWFSIGGDAYFLRPRSELRIDSSDWRRSLIDALRLVTGAMGATFRPGAPRSVYARTVTIGIRGTGIYVDTTPQETYACTCFGSTEMRSVAGGAMMESVRVSAEHHLARRIYRDPSMGMRIVQAPFERHSSEEISRLERLAGRANPFNP